MNLSPDSDKLLDSLKRTLQTPPLLRTTKQLNSLNSFLASSSFFKSNLISASEDLLLKTCESLTYEFHESSDYICRIGDPGTKFYVILRGTVRIIVKHPQDQSEYETSQQSDGTSFGEYALLNNHPRIASVQCITDTHLAVLNKENYLGILGRIESKRIDELVKFLRKFNIFRKWSRIPVVKISYFFKEREYTRKGIVFREGDTAEELFFVKQGEIEIVKSMKSLQDSKTPHFRTVVPVQSANIAIIGPGEIVGEEILSSLFYTYTCRVYSLSATLLVMSKKDFIEQIRSDESQNAMINNTKIKEKVRSLRISSLKQIQTFANDDCLEEYNSPYKASNLSRKRFQVRMPYQSSTPTRKNNYRILQDIDIKALLFKSRIESSSPVSKDYGRVLPESKFLIYSKRPDKKSSKKKYIYPMNIAQKKLYTREGYFRDRIKLSELR